jgi:hypothetical protein
MDRTASSSYHRRSSGSPALVSQASRSSLSSPVLNGNGSAAASQKGRESPNGTGFRSNGAASPQSNGAASPLSNGDGSAAEAAPKEERLIVGVDFGTTYSG